MKRLVSSVLILLILLNVMGYYGFFVGLQYKNEQDMHKRLEAGSYTLSETETIKIPFKAPFAFESETFERVEGDFEKDGKIYRLIKQRHYRDTFHIICIQDKTGTALKNAISDYVRTFAEQPNNAGQQTNIISIFIKEYFTREFSIQQLSTGWEQPVTNQNHVSVCREAFNSRIVLPPEFA